jgi:hypothetical protein
MERDVWFSELPKYYKNLIVNIPLGIKAMAQAFKTYDPARMEEGIMAKDIEKPEELIMQKMKKGNIPAVITSIPRAMTAVDVLFGTIVGNSEAARLMSRGMKPEQADKMAEDYLAKLRKKRGMTPEKAERLTAKYRSRFATTEKEAAEKGRGIYKELMYRQDIGHNPKANRLTEGDMSALEIGVDRLGEMLLKLRSTKDPAFTPLKIPLKLYVPFVKISANMMKEAIKMSPLATAGNLAKYSQRDLAKLAMGWSITLAGFSLAAAGRLSWKPPKDKEQKEEYYSTMNPYSVRINIPGKGETWVPLTYFGPAGLALAIPAAIMWQFKDSPNKFDTNWEQKVGLGMSDIWRYALGQTYMTNMRDMLNAITGGGIDGAIEGGKQWEKQIAQLAKQHYPAQLINWINHTFVDQNFRKARGLAEQIQKDIPGWSKKLESYKQDRLGDEVEAKESLLSTLSPWKLVEEDRVARYKYEESVKKSQRVAHEKAIKKEADRRLSKYNK